LKHQNIEIFRGNIASLGAEAIVNAANSKLMNGSGVCGAIHEGAGRQLTDYCYSIGHCEVGSAVITPGFNLKAKYVIHAVGPVYDEYSVEQADLLLKSCYLSSLRLASQKNIKSIAFPCISTGVFRFPKSRAAGIAVRTVTEFLLNNNSEMKIIFCCFDDEDFVLYTNLAGEKSTRPQ
jgi:O-acetyl-ADP-ribose deacetylase (regulator of RNase III)